MIYPVRHNAQIRSSINRYFFGILNRDGRSYTYKSVHRMLRNSAINCKSDCFIKTIKYMSYHCSEKCL